MGVQTGVEKLLWLFTGTFLFTVLIVPGFGLAVKKIPRAILIPVVYGFLIANLLGFLLAFAAGITKFSAGAFFIWLSVFNLFVVSLFWSKVDDSFSTALTGFLWRVSFLAVVQVIRRAGTRDDLFHGLSRQRRCRFLDRIGSAGRRFERHFDSRPSRGRALVFHRIPDRGSP